MQQSWAARITAYILLALPAVGAAAQELQLQDVPSSGMSAAVSQTTPLDPACRAVLEEALKSRDYARAEAVLVGEIKRNPKSPSLLTCLGGLFFRDGKYWNSAIAMKKAEALSPLDEASRFTLAMAYIEVNHRDWARPELEKLAHLNPQNALYPYWLSRLDYDGQKFTAAVANAQKAIALDPSFMKAYDNLGLDYEALGKYEQAIQAYQEAIRLNRLKLPSSPWPLLNLGALLVKLGRLEEAENYLKESLQDDPRFPQAHYQMGLLLEKRNKDAEATRELEQAAALNPSYAEPYYVLGKIYRRKGDEEGADRAWSTFQKLKKEQPQARVR
jgi:tetratricopeptide (TPR) repeat protein